MPKYPKVYYQMKKMIEICERNRAKVKDQDYLNRLVSELDVACLEIEAAAFEAELTEVETTSIEEVRYDIEEAEAA